MTTRRQAAAAAAGQDTTNPTTIQPSSDDEFGNASTTALARKPGNMHTGHAERAITPTHDAAVVAATHARRDAPVTPGQAMAGAISDRRVGIPVAARFPLLVILSFSVSSLGYSLMGEWGKGDLAAVSKPLDTWADVAGLAAWRVAELAFGWFGNGDWIDLAALNVLSHGPVFYLLAVFYPVAPTTAVTALLIDVTSTLIPFMLLRPLSRAHAGDKTVPNREIISDIPIHAYTVGLASAIYSVVLVLALRLYLPRVFAVYFEGLTSLVPAYEASYQTVVPVMILFGFAARTFIFTPFAATGRSAADSKLEEFDPTQASLGQTFWYNVCGYQSKTKVAMIRTAIAVAVTGINTYIQTSRTVVGVECAGGIAYALVWAVATALTGLGLSLLD